MLEKHLARKHRDRERPASRAALRPVPRINNAPTEEAAYANANANGGITGEVLALLRGAAKRSAWMGVGGRGFRAFDFDHRHKILTVPIAAPFSSTPPQ